MNPSPTVDDILAIYGSKIAGLTQQLVLAEAQIKALERHLAELNEQSTEEDA